MNIKQRKYHRIAAEFDLSHSKLPHFAFSSRRAPYTHQEDVFIIDYICQNKIYDKVKGASIWGSLSMVRLSILTPQMLFPERNTVFSFLITEDGNQRLQP